MIECTTFRRLDLQLFADGGGGDGGTGADGATGVTAGDPGLHTKGVKGNPLANVKYGIQEDVVQAADAPVVEDDRNSRFEQLIKGEFKDLYDQRVQDTIQKRLKGSKETVDRYNALTPTLEILARKYGVDPSDVTALNAAIEEDATYYEDEALELGISVDQLKSIRKMERENAELKRQMQEQQVRDNADRIYADWMGQAENLKQVYPTFDLEGEIANSEFVKLLNAGIDVRTAFEVIHKDDIIASGMQFAAQQTAQKLASSIMSGGRPTENGTRSQASAVVKSDVSQLSKADRQEIIRRVQRGERIRF